MSNWKYYDGSMPPQPLAIGDRVIINSVATAPPGFIVSFTEVDCDYDDFLERAVQYGPYCDVQWDEDDEGDLDRFTGYSRVTWADYPDGPDTFYFDDLIRVAD